MIPVDYKIKVRRSRIEHKCAICGEIILPQKQYFVVIISRTIRDFPQELKVCSNNHYLTDIVEWIENGTAHEFLSNLYKEKKKKEKEEKRIKKEEKRIKKEEKRIKKEEKRIKKEEKRIKRFFMLDIK